MIGQRQCVCVVVSFQLIYIMSSSFVSVYHVKSIYDMDDSTYHNLVDTIVRDKYCPDNFYRDFSYSKCIVKEIINECSAYDSIVLEKLTHFLEYLNTEIPNTEREEFEN